MVDTTQKAREIQREYYRQWRERNKDKIRLYNQRYWEKKAHGDKGGETDYGKKED